MIVDAHLSVWVSQTRLSETGKQEHAVTAYIVLGCNFVQIAILSTAKQVCYEQLSYIGAKLSDETRTHNTHMKPHPKYNWKFNAHTSDGWQLSLESCSCT